ncbi:MAG: prepilin-type N-terminal cleavage/methylation domain-containing protein [Candidatus Saccharibacteria bacterium]|nr:prepilin-type N-terminal cleavage/methylation domain-containing protein [Candidatus Saccharibacteria bacterium]MCA9336373.1 prepilin-type N-terminal cleavage/methylation domain-containing protein [Candidatus Saccharibacteria bacterium]MCA9340591.1 prepilin-type N-terminal cleavage/methylation domain-containing protein [Candidatus Saccharibacteria bacterium]
MSTMYAQKQTGFTIVELLIVIVVIAILAAITIVSYNGIQQRSRDSWRVNDASAVKKALSLYKVDNASFPAAAPNPGNSTFEISDNPGFLSSLNNYTNSKVFKDPTNTASTAYWYNRFNAGSYGCPASLGQYYVFWIRGMEGQSAANIQSGPCTGQTLFVTTPTAGAWLVDKTDTVIYGF